MSVSIGPRSSRAFRLGPQITSSCFDAVVELLIWLFYFTHNQSIVTSARGLKRRELQMFDRQHKLLEKVVCVRGSNLQLTSDSENIVYRVVFTQ